MKRKELAVKVAIIMMSVLTMTSSLSPLATTDTARAAATTSGINVIEAGAKALETGFIYGYPVSRDAYIEYINTMRNDIKIYLDVNLRKSGSYDINEKNAKSYNAIHTYLDKGRIIGVYKRTDGTLVLKVMYEVGNSFRIGFCKASDLGFRVPCDRPFKVKCKQNVTLLDGSDGNSFGYAAFDDICIGLSHYSTSSGRWVSFLVSYPGGSDGKREFRWCVASEDDYNGLKRSDYVQSPKTLLSPLKGTLTRSSSCKTNGQYCDYRAASGTPIYAPADGTVQFRQTYAVNYGKLCSYGNNVYFTSSDGKTTILMAHLSSFKGVSLKYTKTLSYPCSASRYKSSTITLSTKKVKRGDLIGYAGATGNASGSHLHIEVKQNGKAVDPTKAFVNR